jgi:hypothetical protein
MPSAIKENNDIFMFFFPGIFRYSSFSNTCQINCIELLVIDKTHVVLLISESS